jgi:hypothetical protein
LAVGENVGEHVQRQTGVNPQNMREIAGLLDAGLRVEVAADVLDRLGDVARVAPRVPLNAMCSSKCDSPCSSARSLREPAPTKTPSAAVANAGSRR